jgi:hypothetical protein
MGGVQTCVDSLNNKEAIEIHVPVASGSNVVSRCTPASTPARMVAGHNT